VGGLLVAPTLQSLNLAECGSQNAAGLEQCVALSPEGLGYLLAADLDIGQGTAAVVHERRELLLATVGGLPEGRKATTKGPPGLIDLTLVDHDRPSRP